jgi:hypothetical protein
MKLTSFLALSVTLLTLSGCAGINQIQIKINEGTRKEKVVFPTVPARNAARSGARMTIQNAITQYKVDHPTEALPFTLPATATIGASGVLEAEICRHWESPCEGLATLTPLQGYIFEIPVDPSIREGNGAGYSINTSGNVGLLHKDE